MSSSGTLNCDSLYLAPRAEELSLSCAGRIVWERHQGLRILIVTLHHSQAGASGGNLRRAETLLGSGVLHLRLDLPPAPPDEGEGAPAVESALLVQATDRLADLFHGTRAQNLYAPIALRTHADHRLCHQAGRAAFAAGEGRSVFLYEERPEALVAGAVRVRLGELGARLPPAAADAAERAALPRYLARASMPSVFRGEARGVGERLRAVRQAARRWRESRAWNPMRSLGPRLQPVVHGTGTEALREVRVLIGELDARFQRMADSYADRLAGVAHAERYWLLLPPREADGLEALTPAVA